MESDGFSLDTSRSPIDTTDIPDIIARFNNLENEEKRKRTEKSFFVNLEELRDNSYILSINRYQETQYEKVDYVNSEEIINEIVSLNRKISADLFKLKKKVSQDDIQND